MSDNTPDKPEKMSNDVPDYVKEAFDKYIQGVRMSSASIDPRRDRDRYFGFIAGATSPEAARYHLSPVNYDQPDLDKLYEWLMDEKRKQAQTYFTSGVARNVAREIKYRLKQQK